MSKLPRDVPGDQLIRALARAGWYQNHQVGSHVTLRHNEKPGKKLVIPVHPGRSLKPKILQRILREAELTIERPKELL
ncbi:MAG: type II toxin-antitoxin system HicA family toxin [Candidatus Rokubacteria bacterium]|nr:type II toxin-antitoxin system HicA family toxin [Candidatus Rokubacteria bacterium]